MTSENAPAPTSSNKRRGNAFFAFLRGLVRFIIIVIVLALLGAAIYFVPYLYRQYVAPIGERIRYLENAQVSQEQTNQQILSQVEELQNRINTIEIRLDADKQAFSELEIRSDDLLSTQIAIQENMDKSLAIVNLHYAEIDANLNEIAEKLAQLESAASHVNSDVEQLNGEIEDLQVNFLAEEAPIAALRRELQLVKAMELLTRSRFFLAENNLGLAEDDIQAARDLLEEMEVPEYQIETLAAIIERLDFALSNLPDSPVLAADDLEIAWQLLKRGLPGEPSLSTLTETAISTATTTLEPQGTATPNPANPTATSTP